MPASDGSLIGPPMSLRQPPCRWLAGDLRRYPTLARATIPPPIEDLMRYRLLGAMEIQADDGALIAIPAPKRRALLAAMLLEADRPVSTDRLIEALWESEPPPAALSSLHAQISRLRHEIGHDAVVTLAAGYRVPVGDDELDIRVFESELAKARSAAAAGRSGAAAAGFRAALALWRPRTPPRRRASSAWPTGCEPRHGSVCGTLPNATGPSPTSANGWDARRSSASTPMARRSPCRRSSMPREATGVISGRPRSADPSRHGANRPAG